MKIIKNHPPINTILENLASELNLYPYDHQSLSQKVQSQLNELIDDLTKYPSRYISVEGKADKEFYGMAA